MKIVTSELHRNELFRRSEFGGNNVVIPHTSEGALAKLKKLEVVETRQEKRSGKNLLNAKLNVDILGNDQYTTNVKSGEKYTLYLKQKCVKLGQTGHIQHQIFYYDKDNNRIQNSNIAAFTFASVNEIKATTETITIPADCTHVTLDLCAFYTSDRASTIQTLEAQFEEGEGTEYEPYGVMPSLQYPSEIEGVENSVEINTSNKNVLNLKGEKNSRTVNGLEYNFEGNKITLNGTTTVATDIHLLGYWGANIEDRQHYLVAGKYAFSTGNGKYDERINANIYHNANKIAGITKDNYKNVQIKEDTYYSNFYLRIQANTTFNNETFYLQLEPNEISNFVEHKGEEYILETQQKMFKGDAFEKIDGVWYEKHNKKRLTLDGTENFTDAIKSNNIFYRYDLLLDDRKIGYKMAISSHFKETDKEKFADIEEMCLATHPQNRTIVFFTDFTTLQEWKTYLAEQCAQGNAVYIVYQLETPLLLKCTDEQTAVLNKLENMSTYADKTIIMIDNDMTEMTVEAEQSRMSMLENLTRKENEVLCENS